MYFVTHLCTIAGVHESGYYAWKKRMPQHLKKQEDDAVLVMLFRTTFGKYLGNGGSRQVTMQISSPEHPFKTVNICW